MIDFGRPHDFYLETEAEFRNDTVMLEVTRNFVTEAFDQDEGYSYPTGNLYEFKLFQYNSLVQNYEMDITDQCTDQENRDLQKYIDECAADQAADAAERRADR